MTEKALRPGVFHSVPDLITAIEDYIEAHNNDSKRSCERSARFRPRWHCAHNSLLGAGLVDTDVPAAVAHVAQRRWQGWAYVRL